MQLLEKTTESKNITSILVDAYFIQIKESVNIRTSIFLMLLLYFLLHSCVEIFSGASIENVNKARYVAEGFAFAALVFYSIFLPILYFNKITINKSKKSKLGPLR